MSKVDSLHHYQLNQGKGMEQLRQCFQRAHQQGLFDLPGLQSVHLSRALKGIRAGGCSALWVYHNRQAWHALWGRPDLPLGPADYPDRWRRWEQDLLAPLLKTEPDRVQLTSFQLEAVFRIEQDVAADA